MDVNFFKLSVAARVVDVSVRRDNGNRLVGNFFDRAFYVAYAQPAIDQQRAFLTY